MCDKLSQFVVDKYVHLQEFLAKESCAELTAELKRLVAEKQTVQDSQCPKSEAIHGAMAFDKLLVDLLPHFERASGRRLYPTYSYARLYAPGDELKNHTDRESCEISATITLGFDGDVWPIYMGDEGKANASKIEMSVGDAVLYRGMDKHHWREVYTEGKWQAQVFLHYVDADGKHAEWKFDKRPSLNLPSAEMRHVIYQDILTPEACDSLIKLYTQDRVPKQPPVIGEGDGAINLEIRNVTRVMLPTYKDIGGRLAAAGLAANHAAWKFDVTHANQAEFLAYPAGGRYQAHVDTFLQHGDECRKLTVLAFLNDNFKGGKFFLQDGQNRYYPPQTKGTVLVFPSFIMHGVEDVEDGERFSVVCWMVGKFFR
ncbi:Oxoglutarate/iron-dependent dioxygenase [uncultured Caudovirales phage]|uniref:Oxoglutarate/iron-dependent dioxygenase n=1 Tax=uncultured Caudovirales phage TaxID=2100421 RepID=A0A6J5LFW2_9CAUD|nr:Oxoglutarate/iron-dependent dioxygenase [uncultured Caudovirales phage]